MEDFSTHIHSVLIPLVNLKKNQFNEINYILKRLAPYLSNRRHGTTNKTGETCIDTL